MRTTCALPPPSVEYMGWPPSAGELLPRAAEACGVRRKLETYSLNPFHESGGPKARGFAQLLGITIESVDVLEVAIHRAILQTRISSVRKNREGGFNCVVDFAMRGRGSRSEKFVLIRTVWELTSSTSRPRLVTAFPSL